MRDARLAHAMRRARTSEAAERATSRLRSMPAARLASGPGLVAAAFDITRAQTGLDLLEPGASLRLEPGRPAGNVTATPRVGIGYAPEPWRRSEEHTSELQSPCNLVCRLLLEKKK